MARTDDLCEAVKTLIETAAAGDPPDSIELAYAPEADRIAMTGLAVYVFSLDPTTVGNVTRKKEMREYKVSVVIVQRYADAAESGIEAVPEAWVQEKKSWVEDFVYSTLNPRTVRPLDMWPNRCEITNLVDYAQLRTNKIFWSEVEVDYREIVTN